MRSDGRFTEIIESVDEFRTFIGSPNGKGIDKEVSSVDELSRSFIAQSTFMLLATSDAQGRMDVSPKGDPPGFVQVLDDHTLAIPDRPGNRRADSFCNIMQNPRVGLIFLVPRKQETLRISGRAMIVRDLNLRETMAINGKVPDLAVVVTVEQLFFHCAKCVIRSHLWDPGAWPEADGLPSLADAIIAHAKPKETLAEIQANHAKDIATRLY